MASELVGDQEPRKYFDLSRYEENEFSWRLNISDTLEECHLIVDFEKHGEHKFTLDTGKVSDSYRIEQVEKRAGYYIFEFRELPQTLHLLSSCAFLPFRYSDQHYANERVYLSFSDLNEGEWVENWCYLPRKFQARIDEALKSDFAYDFELHFSDRCYFRSKTCDVRVALAPSDYALQQALKDLENDTPALKELRESMDSIRQNNSGGLQLTYGEIFPTVTKPRLPSGAVARLTLKGDRQRAETAVLAKDAATWQKLLTPIKLSLYVIIGMLGVVIFLLAL